MYINSIYPNQQAFSSMQSVIDMQNVMTDTQLINDVTKAIIGEAHAYEYYEKLADLAPNEEYKKIIYKIRDDEAKHFNWFSEILQRLGGQQPEIPQGELPKNFKEGLKYAIRDELEAVAFYRDIAYTYRDPFIRMPFWHASHDEQRHASWLQYMLITM